MKILIKIDTKPKGLEYTRAGSIVEVSDAEGARLCYLGFAEKVNEEPAPKKAAKKK